MFWVHCNACLNRPDSNPREQFYITNCAHIFCSQCCSRIQSLGSKCVICCAKPVNFLRLDQNVPKDVRENIEDILPKLRMLLMGMEFQRNQFQSLAGIMQKRAASFKRELETKHAQNISLQQDLKAQVEEGRRKDQELKKMRERLNTLLDALKALEKNPSPVERKEIFESTFHLDFDFGKEVKNPKNVRKANSKTSAMSINFLSPDLSQAGSMRSRRSGKELPAAASYLANFLHPKSDAVFAVASKMNRSRESLQPAKSGGAKQSLFSDRFNQRIQAQNVVSPPTSTPSKPKLSSALFKAAGQDEEIDQEMANAKVADWLKTFKN